VALAAADAVGLQAAKLPRLLGGLGPEAGSEDFRSHLARLGPRPRGGDWLIDTLAQSGLQGKGGAGFPVWRKWSGLADRSRGRAVVLINASEGEPLSAKDRTLLRYRPHLVLDGAALAAETVGAAEVYLYVSGAGWPSRWRPYGRLLKDRRLGLLAEPGVRVVRTAHAYVAGESSAAARRVSGGPALPRFTPPHVSERGVFDRPTLVQNAETLAHVALIARHGSAWFRELGSASSPGSTLVTLAGNIRRQGVYEIDPARELNEVLTQAGGTLGTPAGALVGGYFGSWLPPAELPGLRLDRESLGRRGASLGCGVVAPLPVDGCALVETSRILAYLARQSAGQCGPCVHGLRALAGAVRRLALSEARSSEVDLIRRWAGQVKGRGACRHPDGAVSLLESVLTGFAAHVQAHAEGVPCTGVAARGFPGPPGLGSP
jgi:NADH:ubiquinone oxidoreductase subunit F (NADH-binding)